MIRTFKEWVPLPLLNSIRRLRTRWAYRSYRSMSRQEVFQHIYKNAVWGEGSSSASAEGFYSGTGSHDDAVVQPYVAAVRSWLQRQGRQLSALDVGCGDFSVGSQLRPFCGDYIACDIVPELIASHQKHFKQLNVSFQCLDLAKDALPQSNVIFVRQVLQHLDNHSISQFCSQLSGRNVFLIVTEHIPQNAQFLANKDKPSGPDTRIGYNSGVILTQAPFSLKVADEQLLCEVPENGGMIQTIVYKLI